MCVCVCVCVCVWVCVVCTHVYIQVDACRACVCMYACMYVYSCRGCMTQSRGHHGCALIVSMMCLGKGGMEGTSSEDLLMSK